MALGVLGGLNQQGPEGDCHQSYCNLIADLAGEDCNSKNRSVRQECNFKFKSCAVSRLEPQQQSDPKEQTLAISSALNLACASHQESCKAFSRGKGRY